jgi:hypothetical protein
LQQDGAAVGLQLEHVFARVGLRRREVKRQATVERAAVGRRERQQRGHAWRQRAAEQRVDERGEVASRGPHDADRATPGGGGDGDDGVEQAGQGARGGGAHGVVIVARRRAAEMARVESRFVPPGWPAALLSRPFKPGRPHEVHRRRKRRRAQPPFVGAGPPKREVRTRSA